MSKTTTNKVHSFRRIVIGAVAALTVVGAGFAGTTSAFADVPHHGGDAFGVIAGADGNGISASGGRCVIMANTEGVRVGAADVAGNAFNDCTGPYGQRLVGPVAR